MNFHKQLWGVYENLEDYNLTKNRKVLIIFDDMIADTEANKKLSPLVNELFSKGRKLNISLIFITHSNFEVPKIIRIIASHYFIVKIPNKKENFNK